MDISPDLITNLKSNNADPFIIRVLNSVNKTDLSALQHNILIFLLTIYKKISNPNLNIFLDKFLIINPLKEFNETDNFKIKFKYTENEKYAYYTYKVFNKVVDDKNFKDRIKELLFDKDNNKETPEIQNNRFELYKNIYNSGLITDDILKKAFKETIEELFKKPLN